MINSKLFDKSLGRFSKALIKLDKLFTNWSKKPRVAGAKAPKAVALRPVGRPPLLDAHGHRVNPVKVKSLVKRPVGRPKKVLQTA